MATIPSAAINVIIAEVLYDDGFINVKYHLL